MPRKRRTPFKAVLSGATGTTVVQVAPGAGKVLGIAKIWAANTNGFGLFDAVTFHWGAIGDENYVARAKIDYITPLMFEPGGGEDFPEEGPENVALTVTCTNALNVTVWGYIEEDA